MTPEREIYLSNRAKEVLENDAYTAAFESIRQEILNQWNTSPARDVDGRESLWLMNSLLTKLQLTLESTMQGGKVAAADLRHKQTLIQRAKEFMT